MYNILREHGSLEAVIKNAKRLAESYEGKQDFVIHNPCKMVWKLMEELLKLN